MGLSIADVVVDLELSPGEVRVMAIRMFINDTCSNALPLRDRGASVSVNLLRCGERTLPWPGCWTADQLITCSGFGGCSSRPVACSRCSQGIGYQLSLELIHLAPWPVVQCIDHCLIETAEQGTELDRSGGEGESLAW